MGRRLFFSVIFLLGWDFGFAKFWNTAPVPVPTPSVMKCYDCTNDIDCGGHIRKGLAGTCETTGISKCFIRIDPNGKIYRGCASHNIWPENPGELDFSYNGCRYQSYGSWKKTMVKWCFCDFNLCNVDEPYLIQYYGGQSVQSRPVPQPAPQPAPRTITIIRPAPKPAPQPAPYPIPPYTHYQPPVYQPKTQYIFIPAPVSGKRAGDLTGNGGKNVWKQPEPEATTALPEPSTVLPSRPDRPPKFEDFPEELWRNLTDYLKGVFVNTTRPPPALTYPPDKQIPDMTTPSADIDNMIPSCDSISNVCEHRCDVSLGQVICSCKKGFILRPDKRTCKDVNECLTNNGGCEQQCINTVGSFYCSCELGFTLMSNKLGCQDINECLDRNAGCSDICENTIGSYRCKCPPGYILDVGNHTCVDYNECKYLSSFPCDQRCVNIEGSYYCACEPGYELNVDRKTCDDIDECREQTDDCHQVCTNTPGSYKCSCNVGYYLDRDGRTCRDTNECTDQHDCQQICRNVGGSYECDCFEGYQLNIDGKTCDDINECLINQGGCDHRCINTEGSYTCACRVGYQLDANGHSCIDVNECNNNKGGCGQTCQNTYGSYECLCLEGYRLNLDGRTCDAIDACSVQNGGCEHICTRTPNGPVCSCRVGYMLDIDGKSCKDINECQQSNGGCGHICNNAIGSFSCDCRAGYRLNVDNRNCDDINECRSENGGCEQVCNNIPGSYRCGCRQGYSINADQRRCSDVNECLVNNGGCAQICTNTIGSYLCSCMGDLFELAPDRHGCDGKCPNDFRTASELHSCYKIFSPFGNGLSQPESEEHCKQQHPRASLVSIETDEEQRYLELVLRNELGDGREMLEGWQGWWTSGMYIPGQNIFRWEASGQYIEDNNKYWSMLKKEPYPDTCVWILQISVYNYTWANYECITQGGHICEINLPDTKLYRPGN